MDINIFPLNFDFLNKIHLRSQENQDRYAKLAYEFEDELKKNYLICKQKHNDDASIKAAIKKLSRKKYGKIRINDLAHFSKKILNVNKIKEFSKNEQLRKWHRKRTDELIHSIYGKIFEIKFLLQNKQKNDTTRWKIRLDNIENKIHILFRQWKGC